MSFRISNSLASLRAQGDLASSQKQVEKSLSRIASGSRIVEAGDDAAGFAIGESLRGQFAGTRQAQMNAQSAESLVQTAEGGLNEQNNILIRLRELAVESSSDTVGDPERQYIDEEFQQLSQEIDRIAKTTQFGHKKLLSGSGEQFDFQVGAFNGNENVIHFSLDADTTGSALGVSDLSVAYKSDAQDSLDYIDDALQKIASTRAQFGAVQSRLHYAIDNLGVQGENIAAARSQIEDVDLPREISKLTQERIRQQAGISVLAQANASATRALNLLG